MKWATIGLVGLGVIGAICAAILVAALRGDSGQSASDASSREVAVLVATTDLPDMTMLDSSSVEPGKVVISQRPKSAIVNKTSVIGKVLRVPLVKGQVVTRDHFATEGTGVHLAASLPEGMRAVTLSLGYSSGLEGLLYPGCVVDVLASFQLDSDAEGNRHKDWLSTTLIERIPVLAIENQTVVSGEMEQLRTSAGSSGRRLVTLRVTPEQAAQLQLASENGTISLVMRNPTDKANPDPARVLLSSLAEGFTPWPAAAPMTTLLPAGDTPPAATEEAEDEPEQQQESEPEPEPQGWQVIIIRGGSQETHSIPVEQDKPQEQ